MKIKKIVAGMVAGVMAASMMSIGASATDIPFDLHYNTVAPNVVSMSMNVTVTSMNQAIYLYHFNRQGNNIAYVLVSNSLDSVNLKGLYTSAPNTLSKSFSYQVLGTTAAISASLYNYIPSTKVTADGKFTV